LKFLLFILLLAVFELKTFLILTKNEWDKERQNKKKDKNKEIWLSYNCIAVQSRSNFSTQTEQREFNLKTIFQSRFIQKKNQKWNKTKMQKSFSKLVDIIFSADDRN